MLGEKLQPHQPTKASYGENPKSSGDPAPPTYPPEYHQSQTQDSHEKKRGKWSIVHLVAFPLGVGTGMIYNNRERLLQSAEDIVNFVQKQI